VYVAFIIDVFARYIVGWKVSSSPNAQMVLDACLMKIPAFVRNKSHRSAF